MPGISLLIVLEVEPFDEVDSKSGDPVDRFKERELAEGIGRYGDLPVEFPRQPSVRSQPCLPGGIAFLRDTGCPARAQPTTLTRQCDKSCVFTSCRNGFFTVLRTVH